MNRPGITQTAITLGVAGSMAGNVAWAAPHSSVLVGVGVGMSLVLPVAVRLWRGTRAAAGWQQIERAAVMGAICGGAALYTLVHTTLLLNGEGLPWVIAWVPATVMELLVVQAARAGEGVTRKPAVTPKKAPKRDVTPPVTAPVTQAVTPVTESPDQRKRRLNAERQKRRRQQARERAAA